MGGEKITDSREGYIMKDVETKCRVCNEYKDIDDEQKVVSHRRNDMSICKGSGQSPKYSTLGDGSSFARFQHERRVEAKELIADFT